ncbi:DUF4330 domain-containing protein [Sporosalibacterium faouarense]|uniref:DUF4330 domain-containing protein n=1 Tax=Sporosalibacterium faouarense TaxID=516123 RepID=UPI00141CC8B9|nr:DUF4330 domain-containing protein [Sporosalibacterium faouarense]MTI48646.1 DUF4330 domain-containing protein [Bacillota bacterium]
MKLIDDKGRLFGLINYIDLAIVLVVVVLIGGFAYYKAGSGDGNNVVQQTETEQELTIKYFVNGIKDVSVDSVEKGDVFSVLSSGNTIGEVVDKIVEPATMTTTDEKGNVIESEIPGRYNLTLIIKTKGLVTNDKIKAYNDEVHVGQSIIIRSRMITFLSTIYGIEY